MKKLSLFLMLAIVGSSCTKDYEDFRSGSEGVREHVVTKNYMWVDPIIIDSQNPGGNVECSEVGEYQYSSGRIDYDNGVFDGTWPDGFTITTDGTNVNWSYLDPNGVMCLDGIAVIVKGGCSANVYIYPSGASSSAGLTSPINPSGNPCELSNLTLCYNLVPCEIEETCYADETAWSDGPRYTQRGNWATYTPYSAGSAVIYAGKNYNAGMVNFSAVTNGMVTITITLNSGFILDSEEMESVKIQGYNVAPSGNPAPGLFTTYKGSMLTVTVPPFTFYGIHLDLLREVPCEI